VRVLHVNTEEGWRGGEAQTLMLARGLRLRGHDSILAARAGSALASRAGQEGFEIWTHAMRGEFDPGAVLGLARLLRSRRPDVVHYHTSHAVTLGTFAGLLAFPYHGRLPAVLTRRVSFSLRRNPLARLKYRFHIDHVIAVADGVRWVLIADGIAPGKVSVIHSGIDLARFGVRDTPGAGRFRAEAGVPPEATLIGCVGALVAHKGQERLLEAFTSLAGGRPGLHLALVGDGPLRAELEGKAALLGIAQRVHLAGFREDIPAVMSALDIMALPSISGEGSPAVVKEAMACRVPVVATELDGVREIVDEGVDALLVPPGDAARLAQALDALLADAALRERLAARALEKVRHYSVETMVERTEEVYVRVLAARARRAPAGRG